MLSIGSLGVGAHHYFTDSSRADYYTEGGEPLGRWEGRGAQALGLEGSVESQELERLFGGFGPDNTPLVQNAGKQNRHPAWDLTFSAPKGISVLWSVADAESRRTLESIHQGAVQRAIRYLEDSGVVTKRGRGGEDREPAHALVVATFQHGTSRARDAQLHTHAIVVNVAQRDDGSWGTVVGRPLFDHKMTAGALYRADVARGLARVGIEVERRPKGLFDISRVPESLTDAHSTRSEQIRDAMAERGTSGARAAAAATLATRPAKEHAPRGELLAEWEKLAIEHGFGWETARQLFRRDAPLRDESSEVERAIAKAVPLLVTSEPVFSERDFIRRLAEQAPGRGLGIEDVLRAARVHLDSSPEIIRLGRVNGELRYTTREIFELERRMLSQVTAAKEATGLSATDKHIQQATANVEKERGYELSEEQRAAIRHLSQAPGSMRVLEGMAGTGKTALLDATRRALEAEGYRVFGTALSGKAARGLERETGIKSATIARRLLELDSPNRAPKSELSGKKRSSSKPKPKNAQEGAASQRGGNFRFDEKTVLVVDEAGMVGTPQMARLVEEATKTKATILWVGDRRQLQPIEIGGGFRALGEILGRAELKEIQRQEQAWERRAVQRFAEGNAPLALREYAVRGLVRVDEDRSTAMKELIREWSWNGGHARPSEHLILTGTRDEAWRLNRMAQENRRGAGELGKKSTVVNAERIHEGDRVLFTRNSRAVGVENGTFGTVERVEEATKFLRVRLDDERTVSVNASEYTDISLGYAATTHKLQGATVEKAYVLAGGPMQDRALSYVQASRAKKETRFYTDRLSAGDSLSQLVVDMARDRDKELAHDVARRATPVYVPEPTRDRE